MNSSHQKNSAGLHLAALLSVVLLVAVSQATAKEKSTKETVTKERPEKPDISFKDLRPQKEKDFDRSEREVRETGDRLQREKVKEEMRDKTHDHRVMVDKDTSVGAKVKDGAVIIDVIKQIP